MKSQQIKNRVYLAQEYLEKANRLITSAFGDDKESMEIENLIGEIMEHLDDHLMEVCIPLDEESACL